MTDDLTPEQRKYQRDNAGPYLFVPGEKVRLARPYQVAGGTDPGGWWAELPIGTIGTIAPAGPDWSWPDPDGDYGVVWDHPTADRSQFCTGRCLEPVAPLPDVLTPDTIDGWLNDA